MLRYGEEFDYANDAVSIESGGIVAKHALGIATDYYPSAGGPGLYDRLAVDCPVTGGKRRRAASRRGGRGGGREDGPCWLALRRAEAGLCWSIS